MGGKVPGTQSYPSKAVFSPRCQCKGMRQHRAKMVPAVTAPLSLAQLLPVFLHAVKAVLSSRWHLDGAPWQSRNRWKEMWLG